MKAILFSLTAAGLSLVLGLSTVAAGEPVIISAEPCCKPKCCKPKCCKVKCLPCKVCKPVPTTVEVDIVSYDCKCEDYCLTKCPPLPKPSLNLKGLLCNKLCGTPACRSCKAPCRVCQDCGKARKRNVLIKRIRVCKEDSYECVPCEPYHEAGPDLPEGEQLDDPVDLDAEDGDVG